MIKPRHISITLEALSRIGHLIGYNERLIADKAKLEPNGKYTVKIHPMVWEKFNSLRYEGEDWSDMIIRNFEKREE